MHAMMYTTNCHGLVIFNTYQSFMHHSENLEIIDDDLSPNLALYFEINAHMNDIIVQQNIFWFTKPCSIFAIPTKGLRSITFNDYFSMKFYTNKKETIKKNLSHQSFQNFLRSWNLNQMILKCSLIHYVMIMLTIMTLLSWKFFFHWNLLGLSVFFNHLTQIRWSFEFFLKNCY